MKLASRLAIELCEALDCDRAFTKYRETFENIIAAKLGQVREGFEPVVAWIESHLPECGTEMSDRLLAAQAALAMLEDE